MEKLKKRWHITSNFQLVIIFIVFAVTGTTAAKIAGPFTELVGITKDSAHPLLYWCARIFIILPVYQVLLILFGWLFGQFKFFWAFEKKMLNKMSFNLWFKE